MDHILEIRNLNKSYDKFKLSDISFSFPRGYIMGFIGANGAGKTTTIKLIMNMLQRDSGEIRVLGKDNVSCELQVKEKIGYVGETPTFYDDMTVHWTADFARRFYRSWDQELFENLLRKFNLDKAKKISELSKGMKMKTSLAIALSHQPELLILDEPTSGLDPIVRDELLDVLMEFIQDERKGVFFSSHITSDIEKIGDYVTFIDEGKIILSEEKNEILDRWKLVKGDIDHVDHYRKDLVGFRTSWTGFEAIVKDIDDFKARYDTSSLIIDNASLDDILLHLARKEN